MDKMEKENKEIRWQVVEEKDVGEMEKKRGDEETAGDGHG